MDNLKQIFKARVIKSYNNKEIFKKCQMSYLSMQIHAFSNTIFFHHYLKITFASLKGTTNFVKFKSHNSGEITALKNICWCHLVNILCQQIPFVSTNIGKLITNLASQLKLDHRKNWIYLPKEREGTNYHHQIISHNNSQNKCMVHIHWSSLNIK